MSDIVVERAKAALQGVTPGPWDTQVHAMPGSTVDEWFVREVTHTPNPNFHRLNVFKVRGASHASRECCWPPTDADAEFIAAARTLVPELIAEVERLREANDTLCAEVEQLRDGCVGVPCQTHDQPLGEKPAVTRDDLLAQGPW
ncbi:hypothetical protein [Mycolicibacterium mageritense]|uniref:hypothetical protein n=1 Tax=Mycolicibacterium mageritense TaxID=53462 RepID=UPI001E38B5D5|nr:hypothetical protein [Mycolicibacterium mageritense]GJJ22314.1 hypothetical protein MTY414_59870 [Mycolicibacterium mageritense]